MIGLNLYADFFILVLGLSIISYGLVVVLSLIAENLNPSLDLFVQKYHFFIAILLAFIYANYRNYEEFFFDLIYINLLFLLFFSLRILLIIRTDLNERSRNNISDAQTFINYVKKNKNLSRAEIVELLGKLTPEDQLLLSDVLKEVESEQSSAAPKPLYDYDEVDLKVQEWADSEEGKARIKRLLDKDS